MNNIDYRIHQIYFSPKQLSSLEKEFIPFNNADGNETEREFYVFKKCYEEKRHTEALLTGFLSWKFKKKTKITGKHFIEFIQANPGYDVYYINPFEHENRFESVWAQGAACHPEIIPMVQFIFDEIGYHIDLTAIKNTFATSAYCNFWVGNQLFWDRYMDFCMPIYDFIYNKASAELRKTILSKNADRNIRATYFPFIFERLFSTLLIAQPNIKALCYKYSLAQLLKKYHKKTAHLILATREQDCGNHEEAKNIIHHVIKGIYPSISL